MVDVDLSGGVAYLAEKRRPDLRLLRGPVTPLAFADGGGHRPGLALLRDSPADSLASVNARPLHSAEIYRRKGELIEASFPPADGQCFFRLNGALYRERLAF